MNKAAKIISIIFHPLLMPTYGIWIIYNSGTIIDINPDPIKWRIYFTVFVMTFLLPAIINALLHNYQIIKTFELSEHRDRVIPLFITLACYFAVFYMTRELAIPFMIKKFIFATTIAVALVFIISVFWKISAHMAGIGGIVSLILVEMIKFNSQGIFLLIIAIAISGLVGTSRLMLNAHKPVQIYIGFFLGIGIVYSVLLLI